MRALLLSATVAVGCYDSRSISDDDAEDSLQALLEDGPLPPTMQPAPPPISLPPRFCGQGGLLIGGPAGIGGLFGGGAIAGGALGGEIDVPITPTPRPPVVSATIGGTIGGITGGGAIPGTIGGTTFGGLTGGGFLGGGFDGSVMGGDASAPGNDDAGGTGDAGERPDAGVFVDAGAFGGLMGGPIDAGGSFAGIGGGAQGCESEPIGFWRFDDCGPFRSDLNDSSNQGHSAFRGVDVSCVPGQEGQAVNLVKRGDIVYAPDQPDFVLDQGVTAAAWVRPERIDGVATILRKRDDVDSAFALVLNDRKFQFVIKLASDRIVSVSTPAVAKSWTHVAATYDGTYLRLYKNGAEVARKRAVGTLSRGVGPLLMGNDIAERRLVGQLDNVWFNTLAAPAETIAGLTCVRQPATLAIAPSSSGPVAAGTTVPYTVSVTSNDAEVCEPASFLVFVGVQPGFQSIPQATPIQVPSGGTATIQISVTSGEEVEPGSYEVSANAIGINGGQSNDRATAQYVVQEPTGCHVASSRELVIRDLSVVDDPVRTSLTGPAGDSRVGAWSFGRLMQRLGATDAAAPDMTEAMLRTFLTPQNLNGFSIDARPQMGPLVLNPWPRTPDGKLDLARAPLRLLAIVNRLDLKRLDQGKAGEGRFVYGVLTPEGEPTEFTVIFEYALPARDESDFRAWAETVHALQELPFPSEEYNAALQAITDSYTVRGVLADTPNGSTLIDIRTNEIALSGVWQLREFHLSADGSSMQPATLFQTPDFSFNFSDRLGRFINANESSILAETHDAPDMFEGAPFKAASVFNNIDVWSAPGVTNSEARHKLSLNTCNGCHGGETNTGFLHIFPRRVGQVSSLSGFMTGITVNDRFTGQPRRMADLSRRRQLLESVVCPPTDP